ncbi:hypothetical protein K469DRAFT_650592 [Zopfia rhizophila CBS 207.26]|uniref:Sensor histidine kinase-like protein/response regulator n=1 Tax=Zopfia rhizophila CBS 207.26 TaxID=1314779 RepID=A0A6A6EXL6_9PEZI|nr:hypothetical protein K469DRAFT_650592 [Zopfia rhizophila CBS 207.26]
MAEPTPPESQASRLSEQRRERNVHRYNNPNLAGTDLTNALQSFNIPLPPPDHIPQSSRDVALAAFAQVASIRVCATRSLICLIDANRQYVLAEATPKLSISGGPREDGADRLWIGNAIIPRCRAVCPVVLKLQGDSKNPSHTEGEHHKSVVIIDDLLEHEQYSQEWFVHNGPQIRFYAGVPLVSADGSIIGALSIFDDTPRPGLGRAEVKILQDLAETTVRHLESITYRQELNRGERMIRGLASFIQGAEALLPSETSTANEGDDSQSTDITNVNQSGITISHAQASTSVKFNSETSPAGNREPEKDVVDATPPREPQKSSLNPQEKLLSSGAKTMFGRAANIIRETSDLDGIVILDASIIASRIRTNLPGKSQIFAREHLAQSHSPESDSSEITTSHTASPRSSQTFDNPQAWSHSTIKTRRKPCHVLGFAERRTSSVLETATSPSYSSLTETDLMRILELYPNGGIIHFDASGNVSSTEDLDSAFKRAHIESKSPAVPRAEKKRTVGDAIQALAPGSRGVSLFPLWNYERGRWFALCLGWSMDPHRTLSPGVDLVYLNAFGNSIMTELSRLDAVATSKSKTTFVQNISHELRSPLHGILGGVQFMQDTSLDVFQASMLSSIEMSGRTLLDTIDHVLDYSKVNDLTKSRHPSGTNLRSSVRKRVSKLRRKRQSGVLDSDVLAIDIATSTEEVVESVFAGASYRAMTSRLDDFNSKNPMTPGTPHGSETSMEQGLNDRKHVRILLDIPRRASWMFSIQSGAWKRIVMNIFGNSLKFTDSGSIRISLDTQDIATTNTNQYVPESEDSEATRSSSAGSGRGQEKKLILTISDTGIGMSDEYLSNHLFTPFSQENSFYTGTGLGMSIVQQLVRSIGGSIAVRSKQQLGTEIKIELPLVASETSPSATIIDLHSIPRVAEALSGKKVCVLEPTNPTTSSASYSAAAGPGLGQLLVRTIIDWFGAEASLVNQVENTVAEFFIFTEPSFESLAAVRSATGPGAKVPIVVFVALDVLEASALRNDARVLNDQSVVEIVTQPCGPSKLARALSQCLHTHKQSHADTPITEIPTAPRDLPTSSGTPTAVGEMQRFFETFHGQYIMIVDDNTINRKLLVAFMNKNGFDFIEAVNGLQALETFKSTARPFSALLMDLSMPVMDGITATLEIRLFEQKHNMKPTKIIALTGQASTSARIEAMSSGINHFLTKPVKFQALRALLG